jgi:RNA polymerase sigma-70 factor (ECF subfamily)
MKRGEFPRVGVRLDSMTDAELVALSQGGNIEAFNSLARKWNDGLFRFVRRMLGNEEDARDICQEAFTKAFVNISRLREPAKFRAWLHHIALNLCRDLHRSAKSRVKSQSFEEGHPDEYRVVQNAETPAAPDRGAETAGVAEVLTDVLGRLSEEQRTAILLREYQGFTSEEVARITGVPATTVRTRIFYGLKSVRRMLRQRGIDAESL